MPYLTINGVEILISASRNPNLSWKKTETNVASASGALKVPTKLVHDCWDLTACFADLELACDIRALLESEGACNAFDCGTALSNGSEATTTVNKQTNKDEFGGAWTPALNPWGNPGAWQFSSGQLCYNYTAATDVITVSFWEAPASGTPWSKYVCVIEKSPNLGNPGVICYKDGAVVGAATPFSQVKYVDNGDGTCTLLIDSRTNSTRLSDLVVYNSRISDYYLEKMSLAKDEDSQCVPMPYVRVGGDIFKGKEYIALATTTAIEEKQSGSGFIQEIRFRLCMVDPKYTCPDLLTPPCEEADL